MKSSPSTANVTSRPGWFVSQVVCMLLLLFASHSAVAQSKFTQRYQLPGTSAILWSITDGNFGAIAVGDNGTILHSTDGLTWVPRQSNFTGWLVAVTYGGGRYVAVGENGTILTSTNGIVWIAAASTGTTARLNNVLYAQGKFVAVGEGGAIVVSTDGATWQATSSGVNQAWLHGLAFGGGLWITTGQGGAMSVSFDGLTWTKQTTNNTKDLETVTFSGSTYGYYYNPYTSSYIYFTAVGESGTVLTISAYAFIYPTVASNRIGSVSTYQPTVYDYTSRQYVGTTNTTARLRSLTSANNVFIATGENGTIISAPSASGPWKIVSAGTTKNLVGAGAVQGTLMLVGESETILQSEQIFLSRLGNVSTRGVATSGANALIAGTVIQGTTPKQLLIRGIGPALSAFGVPGVLADPVLSVFDGNGKLIGTNQGWSTNLNPSAISTAAAGVGAFGLTGNSKDSALLLTLSPGAYTMQVSSASGGSGNALVEAYDLDAISATTPRAVNISTRGQVGTGDNIMIAGLIVQGQSSRSLLVRAVGPTLAHFGVAGTLDDPIVKVVAADGTVLATNDNWGDTTLVNGRALTADEVQAAAASTGAFALTAGSKDAALVITLVPGAYTIQVTGANGTTGIALVEAYDIPNN